MHIELNKQEFQQALEMVSRVSTKHVTLPVLQCVVLEVVGTSCTVKATNLEIGVEAQLTVESSEDAILAVPASTLMQTISLLDDVKVKLQTEGDVLVVEGKKSKTNINTLAADEFPSIPKFESTGQQINRSLFALGIKTSAFACSQSSIKPELGSINVFQKKEHSLTFVATDSFRLMEKTVPQKNVVLNEDVLLPQKNAIELARILDMDEADPQLQVNENQCAVTFSDGVYFTSRLTNGNFPDYEQIIPKEYVSHVTVLKQDLAHAFKRSQVFLNKFQQVSLHVGDNDLTISTNNGEVGTTTESIKASTEGEELVLNFNQRFLSDCLQHFVDDSVILHFAGVGRPLVITGVNDTSVRYLVMPMNK